MSEIVEIRGREILDSRGNPTVEVDIVLLSGGVPRFRRALPPGRMRRSSYVTRRTSDTWERVFNRRFETSTK